MVTKGGHDCPKRMQSRASKLDESRKRSKG